MSLSEWLKIFFGALGKFLVPFIKQFIASGGIILANAAMESVLLVENKELSSTEKRAEAFKLIMDKLKVKGYSLAASTVNGAIEAAVAKLKAKEVTV
jgi:hypothetical protein